MGRRGILGRINGWTLVDAGDVDGIVHLALDQTALLTARTWYGMSGHPDRSSRLLEGLHAYAMDATCDQIVVDEAAYTASLQLASHRERFRVRRQQRRRTAMQLASAPVVRLRRVVPRI